MFMSAEAELERRLRIWSKWIIGDDGYPSKSTIADCGSGDSGVRVSKPPHPLTNLIADELNGWINAMSLEHPQWKVAIHKFYTRKGETIRQLAEINRVCQRTFKQWLCEARRWLCRRIKADLQK